MQRSQLPKSMGEPPAPRPYAMVGAGSLSAAIYKTASEESGWSYRFLIFSIDSAAGTVSQQFAPEDVVNLAKLARVLAVVLAEDGCLDAELRDELNQFAACLDGQMRYAN